MLLHKYSQLIQQNINSISTSEQTVRYRLFGQTKSFITNQNSSKYIIDLEQMKDSVSVTIETPKYTKALLGKSQHMQQNRVICPERNIYQKDKSILLNCDVVIHSPLSNELISNNLLNSFSHQIPHGQIIRLNSQADMSDASEKQNIDQNKISNFENNDEHKRDAFHKINDNASPTNINNHSPSILSRNNYKRVSVKEKRRCLQNDTHNSWFFDRSPLLDNQNKSQLTIREKSGWLNNNTSAIQEREQNIYFANNRKNTSFHSTAQKTRCSQSTHENNGGKDTTSNQFNTKSRSYYPISKSINSQNLSRPHATTEVPYSCLATLRKGREEELAFDEFLKQKVEDYYEKQKYSKNKVNSPIRLKQFLNQNWEREQQQAFESYYIHPRFLQGQSLKQPKKIRSKEKAQPTKQIGCNNQSKTLIWHLNKGQVFKNVNTIHKGGEKSALKEQQMTTMSQLQINEGLQEGEEGKKELNIIQNQMEGDSLIDSQNELQEFNKYYKLESKYKQDSSQLESSSQEREVNKVVCSLSKHMQRRMNQQIQSNSQRSIERNKNNTQETSFYQDISKDEIQHPLDKRQIGIDRSASLGICQMKVIPYQRISKKDVLQSERKLILEKYLSQKNIHSKLQREESCSDLPDFFQLNSSAVEVLLAKKKQEQISSRFIKISKIPRMSTQSSRATLVKQFIQMNAKENGEEITPKNQFVQGSLIHQSLSKKRATQWQAIQEISGKTKDKFEDSKQVQEEQFANRDSQVPNYLQSFLKMKNLKDESKNKNHLQTSLTKQKVLNTCIMIECHLDEIKYHLSDQLSQKESLLELIQDFCMIPKEDFLAEMMRFLKYVIEQHKNYYLHKDISFSRIHNRGQPSGRVQSIVKETDQKKKDGVDIHSIKPNDQGMKFSSEEGQMKFQIIPKVLFDWLVAELQKKMIQLNILGNEDVMGTFSELAIKHMLPHNLYQELGSERGIRNFIQIILHKLNEELDLDLDSLLGNKFNEVFHIIQGIISNDFSLLEQYQSVIALTAVEFYLIKNVIIEVFFARTQRDIRSKERKRPFFCSEDGTENTQVRNDILQKVEISRGIILNRSIPLLDAQVLQQVSFILDEDKLFLRKRKIAFQGLQMIESFLSELSSVLFLSKERRENFLSQQLKNNQEAFDHTFWQAVKDAYFTSLMRPEHRYIMSRPFFIDLELRFYYIEIDSCILPNNIYTLINNIPLLINQLFTWVEEEHYIQGDAFPLDLLLCYDRRFMTFFLQDALLYGVYSALDIDYALKYYNVTIPIAHFWMRGIKEVISQNYSSISLELQDELKNFLQLLMPI